MEKNYRITNVHVDSSYRNINPKNICDDIKYLKNNSLYFTKLWTKCIIYEKNHNLQKNDRIILNNVIGKQFILSKAIEFQQKSVYVKIYHKNHNLIDIDIVNLFGINEINKFDFTIWISFFNSESSELLFGNIPIWIINTTHKIYFTKDSQEVYNNNYYYIKLLIEPTFWNLYLGNIFLRYNNICGIEINKINANYPINSSQLKGFHIVSKIINDNYFEIEISEQALKTSIENLENKIINNELISEGHGENDMYIAKINNYIEGYPNNNKYSINLKQWFWNVKKIKLISTEIPNTQKTIRDSPADKQNNLFYWQLLDDNNIEYWIAITPGFYDLSSLINEMKTKINLTKRINSTINLLAQAKLTQYWVTEFNRTEITINANTNVFEINMFNEIIIDNAITPLPEGGINESYTSLLITHPNHNLNVGDSIVLKNIASFLKIPSLILNNTFTIINIIDSSKYEVLLPKYNNTGNQINTTSGSANNILSPIYFRLLFNKPNTIGNILGFKNVGDINSITPFSFSVKNINLYENDVNLNEIGVEVSQYFNKNIKLGGENYIIMSCSLFKNSIVIGKISNIFAKLLLSDQPGTVIFNNFIQLTDTLQENIKILSNIEFTFYDVDGSLYDFNGVNHSFTIAIYEEL